MKDVAATKRHIVASLSLLIPVSFMPYFLGLAGSSYLVVAALLGGFFWFTGLQGFQKGAGVAWARRLFFVSLVYLTAIYGLLLAIAV